MITVSSERVLLSRVGVLVAAVALLATLLLCGAKAEAQRFGKNGIVYACFKAEGKGKGALRVVANPRKCKKLRGWRATSWSTHGSSGPAGSGGPQGAPGPQGEPGAQGLTGQIEQSLLDTIDDQADQIQTLTTQITALSGQVGNLETDLGDVTSDVTGLTNDVAGLTSDVAGLEGTVGDVCGQVEDLTEQSDELLTAIAGIEIDTLLAVLLDIPPLPDALGTFEC